MKAICGLCFHHCALDEGQTGLCRARKMKDGEIICANYGLVTSLALDPIEKKPLARFHPGSRILSVGSYGCNLRCPFCQNHDIAAAGAGPDGTAYLPPRALGEKALALAPAGNIGLAYTYNEPLVGYEYVRDCAGLIRACGMKNVLVTNGTICEAPLADLLPLIDAMNIDLKGFTQRFYDKLGGDLETVKRTIALAARHCHVEVTTLIVPGENDGGDEMDALAAWLAHIDPAIPLHVSRFFPRWQMADRAPTEAEAVRRLAALARKRLKYVYVGNLPAAAQGISPA